MLECGPPYHLYVAISDDGGTNWIRRPLCNETTHTGSCLGPADNPRNIFVEMTIDRASADVISKKAVEQGMRLLKDDGLEKVRLGVTSIQEISRVT